jgi:hypothetical protein
MDEDERITCRDRLVTLALRRAAAERDEPSASFDAQLEYIDDEIDEYAQRLADAKSNEYTIRVYRWVNDEDPGIDAVVLKLRQVRDLAKQLAVVEASLINYGMETMGLDYEMEEIPEILQPPDLDMDII